MARKHRRPTPGEPGRVLVIVQNLPVPLDRRVWLECHALKAAGYDVEVICPKGPGDPAYQELDGIRIHKYAPPPVAEGFAGYLREFVQCWAATARRAVRVWRGDGFDVIQACNPPDTYWALAAPFKRRGVRFVFDQHDLNPELFRSRFGEPSGLAQQVQYRALLWLERMTYRTADHVIATNESYAAIARERGGLRDDQVTVVRSGPDTSRMRPVTPSEQLHHGRKHLLAYLGVMGPQDGVDLLLEAIAVLRHELGREDVHTVLMGFGDCLEELKAQAVDLGINDIVTFTGRADAHMIADNLSAAEIGLGPDPKSPLNDVSTMNKTMEYMAYALPVVTFDLKETRRSAGPAAVYVPSGDVRAFAQAVSDLLDDPDQRARLALEARRRVAAELDWSPQARAYVSVFDRLFGVTRRSRSEGTWPQVDRRRRQVAPGQLTDAAGRPLVDLRHGGELEQFVRTRRTRRAVASETGPRGAAPAASAPSAAVPAPAAASTARPAQETFLAS